MTPGTEVLVHSGVTSPYVDTPLTNGQIYYFQITAVNAIGEGARSNELSATPRTVPGAPTLNSATPGNSQVTLVWTAPAFNGGSAITGYYIYLGTVSNGEVLNGSVGVVTTCNYTVYHNGITFFFKVAAVNIASVGAQSNELSATPATVPSAPRNLTATPGNNQIILQWSAPASNGGASLWPYQIFQGTTSNGEFFRANVTGLNFTCTGLTNGLFYYFKVRAVNIVGAGAFSNEASATPSNSAVPSPPQSLTTVPGNAKIVLNWAPPADNGGSAIGTYQVFMGTTPDGETWLWNVTGTTYTAIGLLNGQVYYFKVAAVNAIGRGAFSNEAIGMASSSSAPIIALTPSNKTISNGMNTWLGWYVLDGTTSSQYYQVYRNLTFMVSNTWTSGSNITYDTGILYAGLYCYVIMVYDGLGMCTNNTVFVQVNPVSPSAPRNLTATLGDRKVLLTWLAPASDGGASIVKYQVFQGTTANGELWLANITGALNYTSTGLIGGQKYYFKVLAMNICGISPYSAEANATPSAVFPHRYPVCVLLFSLHGQVFSNPIHMTINITYGDWPVQQAWCVVDNSAVHVLVRSNGTATWGIYAVDVNLTAGLHTLAFFVQDMDNYTISQSVTITVIVVTPASTNSMVTVIIVIIILGMSVGVAVPLSYSYYKQKLNQKKQITAKASIMAKQISGAEPSLELDKKSRLLKVSMPASSASQPYLGVKVAQRCALHKGLIMGPTYECKQCGASYCLGCVYQLIEIDEKCFNCGAPIDIESVFNASQQDVQAGASTGVSTVFDPEVIDKVRDLALSDEVEHDVLRILKDIPLDQRLRYLEDTFDERNLDNEISIDSGNEFDAGLQDVHVGARTSVTTLFNPEIIEKLRILALPDELEHEMLRILKNMSPAQRIRYLETVFEDKGTVDEDAF